MKMKTDGLDKIEKNVMRPHLIIDIGERSIFSLIVDRAGNTIPCTQRIMDSSLRYFFGEIFLEPQRYLGANGNEGLNFFEMFEHKNYDLAGMREKIGWIWPYQAAISDTTISAKHPLKVLSSLLLPDSSELMKHVFNACYVLLEIMLEPIFNFVKSRDFDLKEINAVIIIPAYFNRKSRLMLLKLFRKMNVHKSMIFNREIAVMMSYLNFPSIDNAVVLDIENEDVQSYRVNINKFSNTVMLNTTGCFTLPDFGWNSLVKEFCHTLYDRKLIDEHAGIYRSYIDKALMCLIYGIGSTQVPSSPSLKITHDLFDRIFLNVDEKSPSTGFMGGLTD
ncbi:MAG TPA: hypothetical protein VK469_16440, partial [Candidatus Kapabacteria bacterium]|nr:hypothetical protein [Candidatus Kapabacteria bacterium]